MNEMMEGTVRRNGQEISWLVKKKADGLLAAWIGVVGCIAFSAVLASLISWIPQLVILGGMVFLGLLQIANLIRATFFDQNESLAVEKSQIVFKQSHPFFILDEDEVSPSLRNVFFLKRTTSFSMSDVCFRIIEDNDSYSLQLILPNEIMIGIVRGCLDSLREITKHLESLALGLPENGKGRRPE